MSSHVYSSTIRIRKRRWTRGDSCRLNGEMSYVRLCNKHDAQSRRRARILGRGNGVVDILACSKVCQCNMTARMRLKKKKILTFKTSIQK